MNTTTLKKALALFISITPMYASQHLFHYEQEINNAYEEIAIKNQKNLKTKKDSYMKKINKMKENIEQGKRVDFIVRDYKKIDIYVREEYSVIKNRYIMKRPASWRKILIKSKNVWE